MVGVVSNMMSFDNLADDEARARRDYVAADTKNLVSGMMASNDNKPALPQVKTLPARPMDNVGGFMNDENTGFFQRLLKNGGGGPIPLK